MKFAHLGDCHLGSWSQEELRDLNFQSFQIAINKCISERVDFVLIAGDLFDSAYPPIETLKSSFSEFKKLKDSNIPVLFYFSFICSVLFYFSFICSMKNSRI